MVTAETLAARREEIAASADLTALLARLSSGVVPLLERLPPVPEHKALLSVDGGVCPEDGSALTFDPWSPEAHRCPRCARICAGERHDRAWARWQHLWLAERAATLAAVGALADDPRAAGRASALLAAYGARYHAFPNRDNVLGPARLFFSTYLESIWLCGYLAAAVLLREAEQLDADTAAAVSRVAEEAADLIGDFDEGFSNRQTWHNAALAAVAVWFEDEELLRGTVEGPSGLVAHLLRGFGDDGMWYEGENYHLFALRGELIGLGWARSVGLDLVADPRLAARLQAVLRAPALTALPDYTFPARKDSRFGVSLAQPMYLELWEIGLARLGREDSDLWGWLEALYRSPAPPAATLDSYLHEAGLPPPSAPRTRADLSWWALLEMAPALPPDPPPWAPESVLLEEQGLAVLRRGDRYASLECGRHGGGHGHPDRLGLTLHAGGQFWLPDFGTGSYVARDLFWYRSTLAHNAPRLDGHSQPAADASCDGFDQAGDWAWARGRFGPLSRTLVAGPGYLLDLVELSADRDRLLELPWHLSGAIELETAGRWVPDQLAGAEEFVRSVERFVPEGAGSGYRVRVRAGGEGLVAHFLFEGALLHAEAPGAPTSDHPARFLVLRAVGRAARLVTTLEREGAVPVVGLRASGEMVEVETTEGVDHHLPSGDGWEVRTAGGAIRLRGRRPGGSPLRPLVGDHASRTLARAPHLPLPPALDGTTTGFDQTAPLRLDHEDQYRRAEEPFPGADEFSAVAYANWDERALYLAVEVTVAEPRFRPADAAPLELDNEPDDIHGDGLQLYLRLPAEDAPVYGFLIVPSTGNSSLRARATSGTPGDPDMVQGAWAPTEQGYRITLAVAAPGWAEAYSGIRVDFDLLVNHIGPGRLRRAGQLIWSGGGGWVWLRGDRQDPAAFGALELG